MRSPYICIVNSGAHTCPILYTKTCTSLINVYRIYIIQVRDPFQIRHCNVIILICRCVAGAFRDVQSIPCFVIPTWCEIMTYNSVDTLSLSDPDAM